MLWWESLQHFRMQGCRKTSIGCPRPSRRPGSEWCQCACLTTLMRFAHVSCLLWCTQGLPGLVVSMDVSWTTNLEAQPRSKLSQPHDFAFTHGGWLIFNFHGGDRNCFALCRNACDCCIVKNRRIPWSTPPATLSRSKIVIRAHLKCQCLPQLSWSLGQCKRACLAVSESS